MSGATHPTSNSLIPVAEKIREAMVGCLEERDGRYYATEAGCEKLRGILSMHGIEATVTVGADGRFEVHTPQEPAKHTCHWPGCGKAVAPAMWGCKMHWFLLPKRLRDLIWETYRPGQEVTKTPSRAYIAAAQEVQQWISTNTTRRPVMNPPADEAEAGNRANTAPRQADPAAPGRGVSGLTSGSEARPVTPTAHLCGAIMNRAECKLPAGHEGPHVFEEDFL